MQQIQDVDSKKETVVAAVTTTEQDHPMLCLRRHRAIVRL
jgi:hypothetical protein